MMVEFRNMFNKEQGKKKKKGKAMRNDFNRGSLSFLLGEGNSTPLQYSCLENPMDGGAW